jgi:hypothetical protein
MKHIELFKEGFDSTIDEKIQPENWPYIGYDEVNGEMVYTLVPEENQSGYQMIDLGLPSGIKWADKNVGATSPEDAGLYFQWGDTVGYTADQVGLDKVFRMDNCKFYTSSNITKYNDEDKLTKLETEDDAATANMGSQYRMPTIREISELINNTTLTFIDLYGNEYDKQYVYDNKPIKSGKLKGVRFTGSNGNSIFVPAAGWCDSSVLKVVNNTCNLWSSTLGDGPNVARYLTFSRLGSAFVDSNYRYYGKSVRGVLA